MHREQEVADESAEGRARLVALALLALLVGAGAGLIGAVFRLSLEHADRLRDLLIVWAHGQGLVGFLLVTVGCAVTVAAAAWLVRRTAFNAPIAGSIFVLEELVRRFEHRIAIHLKKWWASSSVQSLAAPDGMRRPGAGIR